MPLPEDPTVADVGKKLAETLRSLSGPRPGTRPGKILTVADAWLPMEGLSAPYTNTRNDVKVMQKEFSSKVFLNPHHKQRHSQRRNTLTNPRLL